MYINSNNKKIKLFEPYVIIYYKKPNSKNKKIFIKKKVKEENDNNKFLINECRDATIQMLSRNFRLWQIKYRIEEYQQEYNKQPDKYNYCFQTWLFYIINLY